MIGETIGNFKIVQRIGRGGMGEVWLGEQQALGTKVAIKTLLEAFPEDSEDVARFFNEARAVSRIQHAGITKIFDSGILPNGRAYLVMEFLEGESLAQRIARHGISKTALCDIGRQIASVLDATHNAGITHRDLKPENVFLIPDREQPRGERVKVLDFGVAKLTGTLAGNSPRTFGTLGTPMYMAPEQWGDASQVDWRADLYSLGCVTYEMACGHPPFPVKTVAEACAKHLHEMPLLVSTQTDGIPPELDRLIAQLLEKAPERRPHAIRDVERAFVEIGRSIGVDGVAATMPVGSLPPHSDVIATVMSGAQPAVTQPKKRTPWLAAALVSVLAIGGASAYLIASRDKTSTEPKPTDAPKPAPVVTAIEPDASVPSHEELGVKIAQITAQPQTPARPQAGPRTVPPQSHANVMPKKIARDQQPPAAPPPVTDAPPTQPSSAELPPAPDMDAVKRGLLQGEKALDNCMTVNNVTTKQKLDITIGPVGRATAVAVSGVLANSEYESCVFTVLRSLSFPQSKNGTRFTVPVTPP